MVLQIAEADHPHQTDSLSTDEKLLHECQYYLHMLLRYRQAEQDGEERDSAGGDGDHYNIALKELLAFPRVKALCGDVDDIRYVPFSLCSVLSMYLQESSPVSCLPHQTGPIRTVCSDVHVPG